MASNKVRIMQKEYGEKPGMTCNGCCNLRNQAIRYGKQEKYCVAYGNVDYSDCTWNVNFSACGLHNYPFAALRPARRPLVELYGPKKRKPKEDDEEPEEKQFSFRDFEL